MKAQHIIEIAEILWDLVNNKNLSANAKGNDNTTLLTR